MAPDRLLLHTQQALERTKAIIEKFGPRLAGSESCRKAAEHLLRDFEQANGSAELEPFQTHPAAFMGFYQINVVVYLLSVLFIFLNEPLPSAAGILFIVISGFLEFGFYKEFFDLLYPSKSCANVVAHLEPEGKVKQQIILSGHHDSGQEFRFLRRFQKLYAIRILAPDFFYFFGLILLGIWIISAETSGALPPYAGFVKWFLAAGLLFVLPVFFMASQHGTPGAGDNLIASSILVELCRIFSTKDAPGKSVLKHTRLIFASFDAEESGLRGSRFFARQNRALLQSVPTVVFNIDSIYNAGAIHFLTSDLNGFLKLSKGLAEECQDIAREAGYDTKLARMPFGGGATDAAELAKTSIQATTIIAMPIQIFRDGLVYHTMNDTVEAVEPQAVQACLVVAYGLVRRKEGQASR